MFSRTQLGQAYFRAKHEIIECGFEEEIEYQYDANINNLNEREFLAEYSWVVLCSGMSEKVVRKIFPRISDVFFNWQSAELIYIYREVCFSDSVKFFNSSKKINAIIDTAKRIKDSGFLAVINGIQRDGISYLRTFPFLGPATSYHLAKNIGFPYSKPDRHLVRLANGLGFSSPQELCREISGICVEPIPVVDIVLWRYATLKKNFSELFAKGSMQ